MLAIDETLVEHQSHWLVREIIHFDEAHAEAASTSRPAPSSRSSSRAPAFAGSLFELALAADRSIMFHDDDEENVIALSPMNARPAADEQRADAAADPLSRRRRQSRRAAGARRAVQCRATPKKRGS